LYLSENKQRLLPLTT